MFRRGPLTHIASDFRKKRLDRRRLKSGNLGQIDTVNFKEILSGGFRRLMVLRRPMRQRRFGQWNVVDIKEFFRVMQPPFSGVVAFLNLSLRKMVAVIGLTQDEDVIVMIVSG